MEKLNILCYPDPRLRLVANDVEIFDQALFNRVEQIKDLVMELPHCAGIAATQVDIQQMIFVINPEEDSKKSRENLKVFINAKIIEKEGVVESQEGCFSLPGVCVKVNRYEQIKLQYQDVTGKKFEETFNDNLAIYIQHELDHLHGKLLIDDLSPLKKMLAEKKIKKYKAV